MKVGKIFALSFGLIILIVAWGMAPVFMEDGEALANKPWFIIVWISLFILPFIIIPWYILRQVFPMKGFLKSVRPFKNGIPAEAAILSLEEAMDGAMVTVNNNPFVKLKLEIKPHNKEPYTADVKTLVSRLDIPKLQPGTTLPILIDQEDPENIRIRTRAGQVKPTYGNISKDGVKETRIRDRGLPCNIKILAVQDTGRSENYQPVVAVTTEIWGDDIPNYTLEKEIPMPTFIVKKLKPDMVVTGLRDPEDESNIMMNF